MELISFDPDVINTRSARHEINKTLNNIVFVRAKPQGFGMFLGFPRGHKDKYLALR